MKPNLIDLLHKVLYLQTRQYLGERDHAISIRLWKLDYTLNLEFGYPFGSKIPNYRLFLDRHPIKPEIQGIDLGTRKDLTSNNLKLMEIDYYLILKICGVASIIVIILTIIIYQVELARYINHWRRGETIDSDTYEALNRQDDLYKDINTQLQHNGSYRTLQLICNISKSLIITLIAFALGQQIFVFVFTNLSTIIPTLSSPKYYTIKVLITFYISSILRSWMTVIFINKFR